MLDLLFVWIWVVVGLLVVLIWLLDLCCSDLGSRWAFVCSDSDLVVGPLFRCHWTFVYSDLVVGPLFSFVIGPLLLNFWYLDLVIGLLVVLICLLDLWLF